MFYLSTVISKVLCKYNLHMIKIFTDKQNESTVVTIADFTFDKAESVLCPTLYANANSIGHIQLSDVLWTFEIKKNVY